MQHSPEQQQFFMEWALRLAEKGRLTAPPNPWVGCVIVSPEGDLLGEGFHEAPGGPHAEVVALHKAGLTAKGAIAYITLEPCAHHGRTPPCTEALIRAGIAHVVIPFEDPDAQARGGAAVLRQAGIEVTVGVCADKVEQALAPYLHHRRTGRPYVVLKAALSLDGRLAAADGSSQWITGEEARKDAHLLRAASQAILVGAGTAAADRPSLTVRGIEGAIQPMRIICDRTGKTPPYLDPPLMMATTPKCPRIREWKEAGYEVFTDDDLLAELGKRGVLQLLVEGGSEIHTAFFPQANQIVLYYGGVLLGERGLPLLSRPETSLAQAPRLTLQSMQRFGNDVRLAYTKLYDAQPPVS